MKQHISCHAFILYFCFSPLYLIPHIEIHHIKDVLNFVDSTKKTMVLFDIDQTLLWYETHLGSDHFERYLVQQKMHHTSLDKISAYDEILPLVFHLHLHLELVPIEKNIAQDIALIQQKCDRVVCLTARSAILIEKTLHHLRRHLLFFEIPELEEHTFVLNQPSRFKRGIIFCCGNNKGDVLLEFLDLINYIPDEIIVVDDREYNLDAVEVACKKRGIACIGLRYAGCDHKATTMDPMAVERELEDFLTKNPMF